MDWEGLMRLYGAGDLDEFGRLGRDAGERRGGGGEALAATPEGTLLCSQGGWDVDESGWHDGGCIVTESLILNSPEEMQLPNIKAVMER